MFTNEKISNRPAWPEVAIALVTYFALVIALIIWIFNTPDDQAALRGIIGGAVNGFAGLMGLLAAYSLRLRNFKAFGFQKVERKWLVKAAILAVIAFAASFVIEGVYYHFITEVNTQADFQAAAKDGVLSLIILLIAVGILTPLGEEFIFRGVVANTLNKYGVFSGVVVSAAIFAVAHGFSVILLLAFMVGLMAGFLFRQTQSIWPGIVLHIIYNTLHLLYYSIA